MAIKQDITEKDEFFLGEDKELDVTVYKADGVTIQPITGWTLVYRLREETKDTPKLEKTVANGGLTIVDGPNGLLAVLYTHNDTKDMRPGKYTHSLNREDPGTYADLMYGDVTLLAPIA